MSGLRLPPPTESIEITAQAGDPLETLKSVRQRLARLIDHLTMVEDEDFSSTLVAAKELPGIVRQLLAVLKAIDSYAAGDDERQDELAAMRERIEQQRGLRGAAPY